MRKHTRREFLQHTGTAVGAALGVPLLASGEWAVGAAAPGASVIPSYLKAYEKQYADNPRAAALQWFREARFGLFIHYGLFSLLGRHEWVQLREKIPVAEYAKLADRFTCEKFDAGFVTDMAAKAEMKYINLVTRHHDCFSLWDTKQSDFNTMKTAAKRDLVRDLADACAKKGLGFFCYYSHGRDWRHPHAPQGKGWGGSARPAYAQPQPEYASEAEYDIQKYVEFMKAQITELLTNYGPIAGIWLDGIGTSKLHPDVWHLQELYDHIHSLQPQVLVSYKQGFLGTEDYFAPERGAPRAGDGKAGENPDKPMEICDTLQERGWGLVEKEKHKTPDDVMKMLARAAGVPANLLLNTGPLGDGSIHPDDVRTLAEVGERVRKDGWPKAEASAPKEPAKGKSAKGKKKA